MFKRFIGIFILMLFLSTGALAGSLHIKLPGGSVQVENITFEDGERIETWQLPGGASIQVLRVHGKASLDDLIGQWDDPDEMVSLSVPDIGGRSTNCVRFCSIENNEQYSITLLRIQDGHDTIVFSATYPMRLGSDQIYAMVDELLNTMTFD